MKKVYLFSAIAVMAAMTACTKEPVNTPETPENDGPVPVQFGLASPDYQVSTKSTGGLDAWNNTPLYVFGYDRTAEDFSEANALIYNVGASAATGTEATLDVKHDVSEEGDGSLMEPFYYEDGVNYDFYGYHIDDAAVDKTDPDGVPVPVVVPEEGTTVDGADLTKGVYVKFHIDGSQDLMTAKADPAADVVGATETVDPSRAYSAYAARRGVQPTLAFQHQLARFKFQIRSGSESGNTVKVDSIKILDQQADGYLKVVGLAEEEQVSTPFTRAEPAEALVDFELMQRNSESGQMEGLVAATPTDPWSSEEPATTPNAVGESIMIVPGGSSCTIRIKTSQEGVTTPIPAQEYTVNAADLMIGEESANAEKFEAGKQYTITLVIYGPEDIEITATLEAWEDGGGVEWDPDK